MGILYAILIGAAAGWLAGKIMKGGGFGALINIILGIVGWCSGQLALWRLECPDWLRPGRRFDYWGHWCRGHSFLWRDCLKNSF